MDRQGMNLTAGSELRVINGNGELENVCPSCLRHERHIRNLNRQITELTRNEEEEAREDERWPEVECLHEWWALATNHERTVFGAKEFYLAIPRLKEYEPVEYLQGIAGIAFDPNTKQTKNGRTETYDSWELLNKSGPNFKRYMERAPGVPVDQHKWKRWLINKIEGSFKNG